MIAITYPTFEAVMEALLDSGSPKAIKAVGLLRVAAVQHVTRDDEFNNELPALVSLQAG